MNNNQDKPMTAEEVAFEVWKQHSLSGKTFRNTTFEDFKEHELYVWVVKAMEQYASQSRSPCLPMQWRKASEKLPDKEGDYYIRGGNRGMGIGQYKLCWGYFVEHHKGTCDNESTEWLDESPSGEQYLNEWPKDGMKRLFDLLEKEDGSIVSEHSLNPDQIRQAQLNGWYWENERGEGFAFVSADTKIETGEQYRNQVPAAGEKMDALNALLRAYSEWQRFPYNDKGDFVTFNSMPNTQTLINALFSTPSAQPEDWKEGLEARFPQRDISGLINYIETHILPHAGYSRERVREIVASVFFFEPLIVKAICGESETGKSLFKKVIGNMFDHWADTPEGKRLLSNTPSMPDIADQLRKENPYVGYSDEPHTNKAWNEACNKLSELLNKEKSVQECDATNDDSKPTADPQKNKPA